MQMNVKSTFRRVGNSPYPLALAVGGVGELLRHAADRIPEGNNKTTAYILAGMFYGVASLVAAQEPFERYLDNRFERSAPGT